MAEYLRQALTTKDRELEVETVSDLLQASERLRDRANSPDALLVDLILPDAEHTESVTVLTDLAPHIPLVVLSGAGVGMEEISMRAGADDYLSKGAEATPDAIIRMLRRAVVRREVHEMFAEMRRSRESTDRALDQAAALEKTITDRG